MGGAPRTGKPPARRGECSVRGLYARRKRRAAGLRVNGAFVFLVLRLDSPRVRSRRIGGRDGLSEGVTALMIDCVVDFKVDDRREDLVRFLRTLAPLLRAHRSEPWGLDLRVCEYLGPFATAIIAALWEDAREAGVAPGIGLPESPPELVGYCRFSGLSQLVRGGPRPDPSHPACETVPLRFMTRSAMNDPDDLVRLIRRHHEMSRDAEEYLRLCVNETLQNVQDHAVSPVGGAYAARFLRNRREARVAVVDTGRGVAATLRGRFPSVSSDDAALRAVLEGGHSAKSTVRNMGVGISNMARTVSGSGGNFVIVSGHAVREVTPDGHASGRDSLDIGFPGTAVCFTFPELEAEEYARDDD